MNCAENFIFDNSYLYCSFFPKMMKNNKIHRFKKYILTWKRDKFLGQMPTRVQQAMLAMRILTALGLKSLMLENDPFAHL